MLSAISELPFAAEYYCLIGFGGNGLCGNTREPWLGLQWFLRGRSSGGSGEVEHLRVGWIKREWDRGGLEWQWSRVFGRGLEVADNRRWCDMDIEVLY